MEQSSNLGQSENYRSETFGNDAKSDATAQALSAAQNLSSKSPLHPSTSIEQPTSMGAQTAAKKKGTASTIKKPGKRSNNTGGPRAAKKAKSVQSGSTSGEAPESAGSELEESDHGPYCICRGADDHRWMIFCENCEDWYHGECIDLNKEIGESLIERFICPLCTTGDLKTIYKKTCSLGGCRKAARLTDEEPSAFCTSEHAQTWWEREVAKLPKGKGKGGSNDRLTQEEFMALLGSGLSGFDENGLWRLVKQPFSGETKAANGSGKVILEGENDDELHLSDEEKEFLKKAAAARFQLAEETVLCHKMLTLLEFAHERRQAAIDKGRFKEDICGYDQRLDTVSARDPFEAFAKSPEGEVIFKAARLDDPLGEGDEVRGMCERKRCKIHGGWYKMFSSGLKHHIREMATQADEVGEEERVMRQAAKERWNRKQSENNWVEVLEI
ncbi:unnamed protein product [Fusarium graminearum]|nr:hypothetical protein HG531_010189 [Fusarium graminearum]CZS74331.1 unnamed protein product [Fusarium graminearum]